MRTLASELAPQAEALARRPRLYADANVPSGLVAFMRQQLRWDVLFVLEDDELRRAADRRHYALARQLRRTLITFDRDYLDDRRFPPDESGGVLVLWAPDDRACRRLLGRLDIAFFHSETVLPLEGRKLHLHADWQPDQG